MDLKLTTIVFIVALIKYSSGIIYELNETQYELMPPKFHLDPYEACLSRPGALYCTVDAALVSDTPSPLLDMIQDYTADNKTHFNHSAIIYGICVTKTCKDIYKNTTTDLKTTLEACLNNTISQGYGLKTRVAESIYCNRPRNPVVLDPGDFIVAGVICVLALLNIVGSLYDFHYTPGKPREGIKFLLCFSIRQNWRKLVQPAVDYQDPRLQRLKGCNGIRLLTVTLVIMAHSLLPEVNMIDNPRKVEMMYRISLSYTLLNGTLIVQTFFITSAFLHVYKIMITGEKRQLTWDILPKAIVLRWLRLTPPYAVVLAITSTWFRYAGSGPLWQKLALVEVEDCRQDWWRNLLYINNYKDYNQCMVQTWYLAADTQLFIVGNILCLALQTNRSRKIVLPILFIIGILLPSLHTYFQNLDGVMIVSPETARSIFVWDKTFNNVYKRGHTNLPCYIMGMALGYLVYHWQSTGVDVKKYWKYRYIYWMLLPLAFGIICLGKIFYDDGLRLPLSLNAVYAGLVKPVFGLLATVYIAATVFKYEDVARGILEWKGWTAMARVSYSAYLLHVFFIKLLAGTQQTVLHLQELSMFVTFAGLLALTFMFSYPFFLFVEAPMAELVKMYILPKKDLSTKDAAPDVNGNNDVPSV